MQSFDGSKVAITGRLDKYSNAITEFTTSAQAEGAIEGTIKDVRAVILSHVPQLPPNPPSLCKLMPMPSLVVLSCGNPSLSSS